MKNPQGTFLKTIMLLILLSLLGCKKATTQNSAIKQDPVPSSFQLPQTNSSYYFESKELLSKGNKDDIDKIDYLKFRYAYFLAKQEDNKLYLPVALDKEYAQAMKSGDLNMILEVTDKMLAIEYTNIKAHVMKAMVLDELGKSSVFHREIAQKLIESIVSSGDGKTPSTAFHVFEISDEYALFSILQISPSSQALIHKDGRSYDLLKATDFNGEELSFYFDITERMKALEKRFSK